MACDSRGTTTSVGSDEIGHFFAIYKDLDRDRHSQVNGWGDRAAALETIAKARDRMRLRLAAG